MSAEPLTAAEIAEIRPVIEKSVEPRGDPFPPPYGAGDDPGQYYAVGAAQYEVMSNAELPARLLATIDQRDEQLRMLAEAADAVCLPNKAAIGHRFGRPGGWNEPCIEPCALCKLREAVVEAARTLTATPITVRHRNHTPALAALDSAKETT